jgi:hypothetical protein
VRVAKELDVCALLRNAVSIAEGGRDGEVRYFGEIDNTFESIPGAAFHDLLRGPVRCRTPRHCNVENLPIATAAMARTSIVACRVSEYAKFGRRSGHPEPMPSLRDG